MSKTQEALGDTLPSSVAHLRSPDRELFLRDFVEQHSATDPIFLDFSSRLLTFMSSMAQTVEELPSRTSEQLQSELVKVSQPRYSVPRVLLMGRRSPLTNLLISRTPRATIGLHRSTMSGATQSSTVSVGTIGSSSVGTQRKRLNALGEWRRFSNVPHMLVHGMSLSS